MAKMSTRRAQSLGWALCIASGLLTGGVWAQSPETRLEPGGLPSPAPGTAGPVPAPMQPPGGPMMPPGHPPGQLQGHLHGHPSGDRHGWPHGHLGWRGGPRHPMMGLMMGRLDTDGDGAISRAEMEAAHQRQAAMFDQADTDRDGKLTREEIRAFHARQWPESRGQARPESGAQGDPAARPSPGAGPAR